MLITLIEFNTYGSIIKMIIENGVEKIGIQKGSLAPDFQLENLNGNITNLSDYKGKKSHYKLLGNLVSTMQNGNALSRRSL